MDKTLALNHRFALASVLAAGVLMAGPAVADSDTEYLGDCLKQVYKIRDTSDFVKVEYLSVSHDGDPSFEIEARDDNGVEWEFMCEAGDGDLYEIEQEVASAGDAKFKKNAKVTEQQAIQTVTALYSGKVKEVEYEVEADGSPTFEIDVVDDNDTEWKVEVDAASGNIIEVHVEKWEIGEESGEMASKQ
jgi:uncharacterized membrane protein YkoI